MAPHVELRGDWCGMCLYLVTPHGEEPTGVFATLTGAARAMNAASEALTRLDQIFTRQSA